jgi:hypothetical protein
LDEVRQIREAMASSSSIVVNKERAEIVEYIFFLRIMGVDGEVLVGR